MEYTVDSPYSSTGVENTCKNSLIGVIDWLSVTFLQFKKWEEVAEIIGIEKEFFLVEERGFNGYRKTAVFGNIKILFEGANENMGIHLNISGQGCREYEQYFNCALDWSKTFQEFMFHQINITRLDVAIDDYKKYFTLKKIMGCVSKGHLTSRFKSGINFQEYLLQDGSTLGQTIYFGTSDVKFRFYDKLKERKSRNAVFLEDCKFWQRYEIQLRGDRAFNACMILSRNEMKLGEFVLGVFKNYINFKIPSEDTNKARWDNAKWWDKFLQDVEKIPLTQISPEPTIPKTKTWIENQVTSGFVTLLKAFDDEKLVFEYLKKMGNEKTTEKHEKMLSNFNDNPNLKSRLKADIFEYVYFNDLDKKKERLKASPNKNNVDDEIIIIE